MKNLVFFGWITLTISLLFTTACKDKVDNYLEEQKILAKYIADSNITVAPTYSGLYYIEKKTGNGVKAELGYTVSVKYKGMFLDGTVFDTNMDSTDALTFPLGYGYVIRGWDEGISYMRDGGIARLIIPSPLAYGAQGSGSIPPYTTLVFDVELVNVQ